jgi:hypothetical protein
MLSKGVSCDHCAVTGAEFLGLDWQSCIAEFFHAGGESEASKLAQGALRCQFLATFKRGAYLVFLCFCFHWLMSWSAITVTMAEPAKAAAVAKQI